MMWSSRMSLNMLLVSEIFISFHFISFHFISFHFISFHFISFHFISFHVNINDKTRHCTCCKYIIAPLSPGLIPVPGTVHLFSSPYSTGFSKDSSVFLLHLELGFFFKLNAYIFGKKYLVLLPALIGSLYGTAPSCPYIFIEWYVACYKKQNLLVFIFLKMDL